MKFIKDRILFYKMNYTETNCKRKRKLENIIIQQNIDKVRVFFVRIVINNKFIHTMS